MGKFAKWIAGGLGWAFLGPIGGLIGFGIGSIFDNASGQQIAAGGRQTTSGAFAMSLLVLVAAVMKADNKILRSELDYVKKFFLHCYVTGFTETRDPGSGCLSANQTESRLFLTIATGSFSLWNCKGRW